MELLRRGGIGCRTRADGGRRRRRGNNKKATAEDFDADGPTNPSIHASARKEKSGGDRCRGNPWPPSKVLKGLAGSWGGRSLWMSISCRPPRENAGGGGGDRRLCGDCRGKAAHTLLVFERWCGAKRRGGESTRKKGSLEALEERKADAKGETMEGCRALSCVVFPSSSFLPLLTLPSTPPPPPPGHRPAGASLAWSEGSHSGGGSFFSSVCALSRFIILGSSSLCSPAILCILHQHVCGGSSFGMQQLYHRVS